MIFFFRTIHLRQLQRRGAKIRAASRRLLAFAAFLIFVSGCAPSAPVAVAPSSPARSTPERNSANSAGINSASKTALEHWWNALSKSAQSPAGRSTPASKDSATQAQLPIVAVDVAAVAARHPAWKLANALEKTRVQPIRFEPFSGSASSQMTVASPSFDVNFNAPTREVGADQNDLNATSTPEEFFADSQENSQNGDNESVTANDLEELEAAVESDQRESITEFLRLVSQRQSDWANDYNAILKTALEEDVTAMKSSALPPISPFLPSAEAQLEMTNLRLQLSRNIFATEPEVEAARARLDELLEQWRASLRAQQQQRVEELQRVRVEEPQNAKGEGLQKIARDLDAIRDAQQSAQTIVAAEHRARVDQDFGDEQARLGIVLPAGGVLQAAINSPNFEISQSGSTPLAGALAAFGIKEQLVFVRTNSVRASSVPGITALPFSQAGTNSNAKATRISALRTLAWQEAIKQIQMASRRAGWQWRTTAQSQASKKRSGITFPDRTQEILQMLSTAPLSS